MKDKGIIIYSKKRVIISIIVTILVFLCCILLVFSINVTNKYNGKVLPNSYIHNYSIGDYSLESLGEFIDFLNGIVNNKKLTFIIGSKEVSYSYSDIGLYLNKEKMLKEIELYQNNMGFFKKQSLINKKDKKIYDYIFTYNSEQLKKFMLKVKNENDQNKVDGYFIDNNGISYVKGINGYSLDVDKSIDIVVKYIEKGLKDDTKINLSGDIVKANSNDSYATIDTLVSSFSTEFNPSITARAKNLYTALNYINGVIVEPGEEFSYYKYAGPFDKAGYVFYYEFVGNGVCQIATTTYNAALLGGLQIIKRYPHAAKSVYVPGGLDATVASYSSGWYVDMVFKNTYSYPIYIKAYAQGGKATVEFWSNKDAKKGYEYKTESVQIGYRGYKSYLHVYKDGVEVDKRLIATTWYSKDS